MIDYNLISDHYKTLSPKERLEELFNEYDPEKILMTSSFGSTSVILLHLISQVRPNHPVYFIDTGYLFEETVAYKDLLAEKFNLNIQTLKALDNRHRFTKENQSWKYNKDLCCFINKVDPVDQIKSNYDIWISGLLGFQNVNRQNLRIFEPKEDIVKFHPIIDLSKEDVSLYTHIYDLPTNPLVFKGYDSIGCTHCTHKGQGREGRWIDSNKTECGLHV
ncbi:phosphoadenylyl-sulfate reductase [Fulvivirgaceae bacterium BMA10]|uniref:Adenosine 5'-phosphosulfate reductase n=1 Tax=Splendidivirga corallicola TaxID=3051826 RepID=A0ABT8KUR0_9BACT|nr:phosphoadenylyl-sulfate reductase [Fulvivirgaceae bacterium BMA10]